MAQITEGVCRDILNGQGYTDWEAKQLAYYWINNQSAQPVQQRELVGLTDEEMYEAIRDSGRVTKSDAWEIVENLKAKLKEKNQ